MAYVGKVYKMDSCENFDGFLKAIGVSADKIAMLENYKPSIKMEKNGDSYTMTTISTTGTRAVTFNPGVEFNTVSAEGTEAKSTFTVDGDTFTEVQKFEGRGTVTFKREFFADKLVVTITASTWDGVAKRFYTV